ncbi:hypothetical protein LCGC14_0318130 [marine sediment metagenome]|uniref:Uncharacterized protein n=1 Tax=marine sediment metagenome TaxID=412755 RepID=A0A0F9TQD2_9ZZZZ
MLCIKFIRSDKIFEWHVREGRPGVNLEQVDEIQADGDELEYIKTNFTNLPMAPLKKVVRWRGEHARFILNHL